jgi:hypothetical protein
VRVDSVCCRSKQVTKGAECFLLKIPTDAAQGCKLVTQEHTPLAENYKRTKRRGHDGKHQAGDLFG